MRTFIISCFILLLSGLPVTFIANIACAKQTLPVPRFVSIKRDEANIRTGPHMRYPIKWVFKRQWMPVEIIAEFEQWRKIRDVEGEEGWIHESLLSGRRNVIIQSDEKLLLFRLPKHRAVPLAHLEPGVQAELLTCKRHWCQIEAADHKGWLLRRHLWGVYQDEIVD